MGRRVTIALGCALAGLLLGGARAQEPAQRPGWRGSWSSVDGAVRLVLAPGGGRFGGELTVSGTTYALEVDRGDAGHLEGRFHVPPQSFAFTLDWLGPDRIVLRSDGFEHHLLRVAAGPPASAPGPAVKGGEVFRQPQGLFTLELPPGWRATPHNGTALVDPGAPGVFVQVIPMTPDPEDVGRSAAYVLMDDLAQLVGIVERDLAIRADASAARAATVREGQDSAAWLRMPGLLTTAQGQMQVGVFLGVAVRGTSLALVVGTSLAGEEARWLPWLQALLAGLRATGTPQAVAQAPADPLPQPERPRYSRRVSFNRQPLDDGTIAALEQGMAIRIPDGDFWYDPASGAMGAWGGPTFAFFPPGLRLGGPLSSEASGGRTAVFVNGRALHPQDVAGLQRLLGAVMPGRYWLDAAGNYGVEGGPAMGNLMMIGRTGGGWGGGGGGGGDAWTRYTNVGGDGMHFGSFGGGDFYFSDGTSEWWPGK